MKTSRLEAFSDGVLAIIITIMALELSPPKDTTINGLVAILPTFISYLFSFIYLATYWSNHHHLLQITEKVNGKILWANLNLLFWLSLIPFTTAWIGENHITLIPVIAYGVVLLICGISYYILQKTIIKYHDEKASSLERIINVDRKSKWSLLLYAAGIGLAFVNTWISLGLYMSVVFIWFLPERRIEKKV